MQPEPVSTSPAEHDPDATSATPNDDAIAEIEDLRDRLKSCEDRATRAAADLDNLQKRFTRELSRGQAAERRRVLGAWVASVDDLDRAVAHSDAGATTGDDVATIDGVRAIAENAVASIATFGYPRFAAQGDVFDPEIHEVISTVPAGDEAPAKTVVAIIKAGYGTTVDLLRPASVVVARDAD